MGAFDLLRAWPDAAGNANGRVAAAIVDRNGVRADSGPTNEVFALASVTKLLVALAVLVAVEEGTLSLDDAAGPPGSTVRHLLSHASGLAPDAETVAAPPARRRIYSNAGFDVLGRHLEGAGGLSVATYVAEAVAEPLRLRGFELRGSPAHGAEATTADLALVAVELLQPTLLSPSTLAEATTPAFPDLAGVLPGFGRHDPNPWGLGLELRGHKSPHWTGRANSAGTFGHFGRTGTFCWVDPLAGLGLVVLSDLGFGPWAVEHWPPFADAVLADLG